MQKMSFLKRYVLEPLMVLLHILPKLYKYKITVLLRTVKYLYSNKYKFSYYG